MQSITDFFMRTVSSVSQLKKRRCVQGGKKRARCSLVADEASQSGSDHSGASDDEWSDDEKAKQASFVADSPVKERRQRLPKLTAAEKVVSEDELENLKDACVSLATSSGPSRKKSKGYADAGDFLEQTEADLDFIASSDSEDLEALEREASVVIHGYVSKKGVGSKPASADKKRFEKKPVEKKLVETKPVEKKQAADTKAAEPSKFCPGVGLSIGTVRVRELNPNSNRQVASIFKPGQNHLQNAKPKQQLPAKRSEPGLVVNPVTKEVHYRHPDGRMSPRPGAL